VAGHGVDRAGHLARLLSAAQRASPPGDAHAVSSDTHALPAHLVARPRPHVRSLSRVLAHVRFMIYIYKYVYICKYTSTRRHLCTPHTHYQTRWRGRGHTREVYLEFSRMYALLYIYIYIYIYLYIYIYIYIYLHPESLMHDPHALPAHLMARPWPHARSLTSNSRACTLYYMYMYICIYVYRVNPRCV